MTDGTAADVMRFELDDQGLPPEDVDLDAVRVGLEHDEYDVRTHAATVAAGVARRDADRGAELAPVLRARLDDDSRVVVHHAAGALAAIADDHPDAVEPAVESLVDLLDHELPNVRSLAARSIGIVAADRPERFVDLVDDLVAATTVEPEAAVPPKEFANVDYGEQSRTLYNINKEHVTDQVFARQITANLLVEVAETEPEAVAPHVPRLVDALSTDDVGALVALVDVLGTVAEADTDGDTDALEAAVDPLCDLLDHDSDELAATAVRTLGLIGDPAAVDPLQDLAADDDRDEDLRAFAAETADFLDGRAD